EPPNERPPKLEPESITPGASSATEARLWSTGNLASCSRVTLVADSVERTSTRLTTREPTTCTAAMFTMPSLVKLTVVVPPSDTLTDTGSPDPEVRVYWPGANWAMR